MPSLKINTPEEENQTQIILDQGATITANLDTADAFVFCTSLRYSKDLMLKLGYKSYYRIVDTQKFAETLFFKIDEVKMSMNCFKVGLVTYSNKELIFTEKDRSRFLKYERDDFWKVCFTKPEKFRCEKEIRMIFAPQFPRTLLDPIDIKCPQLLKYCKFK